MTLKKMFISVIPAFVLALGAPGAVWADMVMNGGFETSNVGAGQKLTWDNSSVANWSISRTGSLTFVDAPGTADNGTYLSVYGPFPNSSPAGGNFVEMDGDATYGATIYQTITGLTQGQLYAVTFYQAAGQQDGPNYTSPTTERWAVGLGDTLAASQANKQLSQVISLPGTNRTPAGNALDVGPWESQTILFTADRTGSEVLSFMAVGTPSGVPPIAFLDGVTFNAVPEPASLLLVGIGLVGSAAARRFRRGKSASV